MSNPHPTTSKPNKIGRKHTQGLTVRQKARKAKGKIVTEQIKFANQRKKENLIKKYWNKETDIYPE